MKNPTKVLVLFLISMLFGINVSFSQEISEDHRRVLSTDSCMVFNLKFSAKEFGESYFMFFNEYNLNFSENEYNEFKLNCGKFSSAIKVFKSTDYKKLICVFPKIAMNGIESLDGFLNANFSSNCKTSTVSKKITFIEVRDSFDPLDSKSKKGFN